MKLTSSLSSYLDFMRFLAALAVMLAHMSQDGFDLAWLPLIHFSHEAVIVFFVMSGFIIHASTANRKNSAINYIIARASRVYAVAIPSIIFSISMALAVDQLAPQLRAIPSYRDFSIGDMVASLLFINESWSSWTRWNNSVPLNAPYWSLCYEVWYYALFGLFIYGRGRWRWLFLILAATFAGPAVLALFPIWLMGAWLSSRWNRLPPLSTLAARALFVATILCIDLLGSSDVDQSIKRYLHANVVGYWRLESSQLLLTDHLLGVLITLNLYAFPYVGQPVTLLFDRHQRLLSALAGFSFSLYLFHRPITTVAGHALTQAGLHSVPMALIGAIFVLIICWLVSFVTERRLVQVRRMMAAWLPLRTGAL